MMDELILKTIEDAMGGHFRFFDVTPSEMLSDDDNYYSKTFLFKAKRLSLEDCVVKGNSCLIVFQVDPDNNVCIIVGDDTEEAVTLGKIYCILYWDAATVEIDS